ncbi:hypothetical protein KFL_002300150 [Klebsormidium nitens]|uniref:JmjC domain-containing protein n=1 Tax=Klebsormidium nitens TaxID=105231 RepID=A0A1Y1I4C0_KLENI|nr:hypothetical protein KFL_002300150 [Klebsormidium nitens]|eukprot:GAQ85343.1 hypothetical protein KFL_002300150 [Klebsormidium nitens]
MAERRSKRARVVDYAALDSGEFIEGVDEVLPKPSTGTNAESVDYKKLSKLILKGEYGDKTKVLFAKPEELEEVVRGSGFQSPIVVKDAGEEGLRKLGIRLPDGELTVDLIARLVGPQHAIPTIDVATQAEGPKWTMEQWRYYWNMPPSSRKKLLNVVSLGLFGTGMESQVTAPSVVRDLDLVSRVWPPDDWYPPKVQLYVLMSPQGCYTDFHVDMGGSCVWYHLVRGKKVFLVAPPSAKNLEAFEEWASSEKQGSVFLAEKGEGWQRVEMEAGDTLLMPGGWPHAVVTPVDSIAVGGNFQTGQTFTAQANVWKLEDRLRVRPKFRFPSFKQLMWYAAYYYVQRLQEDKERTGGEHHSLSRWESSGLRALVGLLKGWQVQARGDQSDVPASIPSPDILLHELEELLPPPPSPRLITIKRTDSSAGSLDKAPSEKESKPKSKPPAKAAPPRPPQKTLGVKGRLLAKLGMKRSQPIFSLPRVHTEKVPPKAPPPQLGAERPAKRADDVTKEKYGGLRIQVETIEPEGSGRPGEPGGRNGHEAGKGERYGRGSTSTGGSGDGPPIKIPKIVIRGLSGLGSPRGALGEQPRVKSRKEELEGPITDAGRETERMSTKRKVSGEESGGGTGSESLSASEKDFAKLLIRLGKRRTNSDTTSRSESPFPDAAAADVALTSARDGDAGPPSESAHGPGFTARMEPGDSIPPGHELSRFASACLMTSAVGSSRAGEDSGDGSFLRDAVGSSRGKGRQGWRPGEIETGGLGVIEEGEGLKNKNSGTAGEVGASAMMREFLSVIGERRGEETLPNGTADNAGSSRNVVPDDLPTGSASKAQPADAAKVDVKSGTRTGPNRSAEGRERQSQTPATGLRIDTERPLFATSERLLSPTTGLMMSTARPALGASEKVLSPTAARAVGGAVLSPRRPPLPAGLLERTASKLTLGMKGAAQKRRAIMLTEVKPDPEVLAQRERAAAEAQRILLKAKSVKKTESRSEEESQAVGAAVEVADAEGLDREKNTEILEKEGASTALDLTAENGLLSPAFVEEPRSEQLREEQPDGDSDEEPIAQWAAHAQGVTID